MDPAVLASIIIALIAAGTGIASQRSASKALEKTNQTSNRVEMEKEAYIRARKLDVETIERQEEEISELRDENRRLRDEMRNLKNRINNLEKLLPKGGLPNEPN